MKRRRYNSNATSPGIVIGSAFRISRSCSDFERYWLRDKDIKKEVKRFQVALQKSREQLSRIQTKLCRFQGREQIKIIESHRMFLQDDMLVVATIDYIKNAKINAEWALDKVLAQLKLAFFSVQEEYLRERSQDIDYVGRRLMGNLLGSPDLLQKDFPKHDFIVIAHDISPAEVVNLPKDRVMGFVMEMGGETSHSAIIARALEIPALFGVEGVLDEVKAGEQLILDGIKGSLIASPHKKELEQYHTVQAKYEVLEKLLLQDIDLPTETRDGHKLSLEANIELVSEVGSALQHGAEGIGLYRTEYLFLDQLEVPSEEEQIENYLQVLEQMHPKPVTIRTIDLGGDKMPLGRKYSEQANPALGVRGIRLCLRERRIFKTQLRALFRASVVGNLKILLPMVSGVEEVRQVKKIIREVKRELAKEQRRFDESVQLGIMIEVPSAVMVATDLAREVDFFSIGTNDLLQYGLAVDRTNELVNQLSAPLHPALLRMIQMTVKAANEANIPVSMCGEMAGDPLAMSFLIGMDLSALSMNPVSIPRVKKILRSLTKSAAAELFEKVIVLHTVSDVSRVVKKEVSKVLPAVVDQFDELTIP